MPLVPFSAGLAISALLAVSGSQPAHIQVQGQQTNKTQQTTQTQQTQPPDEVVVMPGDTLDGIAAAHQTTYVRLFDANTNITDPNLIFPGESLRIPDPSEQLPDRSLPEAPPASAAQPQAGGTVNHAAALPTGSSAPVAGCGDNSYANFIYTHESGCRTTAMSPNGCYGIGQACPASKIAYCGADYACQNAYFSAYAGKYGGWAGAYAFWVSHGWW